jgi:hypothetical protein
VVRGLPPPGPSTAGEDFIVNREQFIAAYREADRAMRERCPAHYWRIPLDRVIIAACRANPRHSDLCEVNAKVALVNRMYSAQLGRGRLPKYEAEWQVAEALTASNIDEFLAPILDFPTLTQEGLQAVVNCHNRLVEIVRGGSTQESLSFSSKYLSFHVPRVVPILDSRAEKAAREIIVDGAGLRGSGRFEKHCRRVLQLLGFLRENGVDDPDIKIVDHVLYAAAETPLSTASASGPDGPQ